MKSIREQLHVIYMRTLRDWYIQARERIRVAQAKRRKSTIAPVRLQVFKVTHNFKEE